MGDNGDRRKTTGRTFSGDKDQRGSGLPPVARQSQKQLARRHNSSKDSSDVDFRYDDAVFDDTSDTRSQEQLRRRRLKMQQSADIVDASGASSGANANSNSFKTLWKKAVNKLKLRRTRSTDDSKFSSSSPKADEEAGEEDPVYSFLKLTSGKREGVNIIPGEDHYCCSKTDQDIGVDAGDAAGYSDPSHCQCPCHLPERLQSAHDAWMQSFASKKT